MPGSFMQLAAFGLQDLYLIEQPQMTFWKNFYFKHTNFAIESIQHSFTGIKDFDNIISCTIPKDNGDLIGKSYITTTISNINKTKPVREWSWVNKIKNPANFNEIYSQSVKISPDGTYSIITGFFSGEIEFDNNIIGNVNKSSIFVLKVDSITGDYIWMKTATNNDNQDTGMNFMDVIILNDDSIYLTGYFHNVINFDTTSLVSTSIPNNYNSFVVKLSSDGTTWSSILHIESTDNCVSKNIIYINNNIYIAGDFSLDLTINGSTLLCNEKSNGFICCLTNIMNIAWLKQIRGLNNNVNSYVRISTISCNINSSSIVINGNFFLQARFDGLTLNSLGKSDIFIAKILLDGTFFWVNQVGGDLNEVSATGFTYYNSKSIKVLSTNDIVLIGIFFSNIVNFGNDITLNGDGNKNTFIAKLSYDNTWLWAIKIDNPENYINTCPSTIFTNNMDDSIYVSGSFGNPTYTIGNTTLTNYDINGTSDTYVIKISSIGEIGWAMSIGGNKTDFPANLDISSDGEFIILIGYFDSSALYIGDFMLNNDSLLTYTYITRLDFLGLPIMNRIGFQILNYVELRIGGKTIDKHYSNWMYIWSELSHTIDMKQLLDKMVGSYNDKLSEYTLTIPLFFAYCRHNRLALPLISLKYHDVEIYVNLEKKDTLFGFGNTATIKNMDLWIDYYFLDTDERQTFAEQSHDYLIETVQYQEEYINNTGSINTTLVKLDFNHPIKYLAWGIKTNSTNSNNFDYTDNNISCFISGQLFFNNRERTENKPFNYFNYCQPYQHFKILPQLGINIYSFALEPIKIEPTGTCNFSFIDKPDFNITTSVNASLLYMYAVNYNILTIKDGMGGLVFTN